jgi:hypothetical protein
VRGDRAERVPVTFGISSVDYFEIREGLSQGDEVIVSDMREYTRLSRIRIE